MFDSKNKRELPRAEATEALSPIRQLGLAVSATSALLLGGCRVVPEFKPEDYHVHQRDFHSRDALHRAVEQGVLERIRPLLKQLPSAQPHLEFLERHSIAIEFDCLSQPDADITSWNVIASCADNGKRIDINRDRLAAQSEMLSNRGLSISQIVDVATLTMAPIFVHEIRHAMTDYELDQGLGFHIPNSTLEDEALSRFDQAECFVDVRAHVVSNGYDPRVVQNFFLESTSNDELIWRMVRQDLASTLSEVQSLSGEELSVLSMSCDELSDKLAEKLAVVQQGVKNSARLVENRKGQNLDGSDELLTQQAVEHVDSILVNGEAALRESELRLSSPESHSALSVHFRAALESYETRWKTQFGELFRVKE